MDKISTKQKIALILFGLFLSIALLEIGLWIGGFVFLSLQEYRNKTSFSEKGEYRILCLGESTTADMVGSVSWPRQLEEILNNHKIGINFNVINKGRGASNTTTILFQLKNNLDRYAPDMVITMMGVNDDFLIMPKRNIPAKRAMLLFESFRVYKLAKLLQLHIMNKFREKVHKLEAKGTKIALRDNINGQAGPAQEAIELNPEDIGSYLMSAKSHLEQGDFNKAQELFRKVIELDAGNDMAFLGLGVCFWMRGQCGVAEKLAMQAIELNPKNARAYAILGWFYWEQANYDAAQEMFMKAIKLNPENSDAYAGLGGCYWLRKRYNKSQGMFEKAIGIDGRNPRAYTGLGGCYWRQGQYNKAQGMFEKAIGIDPKDFELYLRLGGCYSDQGDYVKAQAMFEKVIEMDCLNHIAYNGLGWCYWKQGKHKKAKEMFNKAEELDPEDNVDLTELEWPYWITTAYSLTERLLRKAIEINHKNYDAYVALGFYYYHWAEYNKARAMLEKAIEIKPDKAEVYISLAKCYSTQNKQQDNVEALLIRAIENNPDHSSAYGDLAYYYAKEGKNKLAEEYFSKAHILRTQLVPYDSITEDNFRMLKKILAQRGIRLVCAQYPVRSLEPLRRIFDNQEDGIIFVDNEMVFKEAIKKDGINEYFTDLFASDFGHGTTKGNRLLAENIANVILKECFNQPL